jgi:opacity protein-like surface antigen
MAAVLEPVNKAVSERFEGIYRGYERDDSLRVRSPTLAFLTSSVLSCVSLARAQTGAVEAVSDEAAASPASDGEETSPLPSSPAPSAAESESEEEEQRAAQSSGAAPPLEDSDGRPAVSASLARPPPAPPSEALGASSPDPDAGVSATHDSAPAGAPPHVLPPYMGLELFASMLGRVSDSSAYQHDTDTDMGYGAGVWYEGGDRLALGASYEYSGLGEGESKTGADYIRAEYRVHGLWAAGRAYPYRSGGVGVFATAGVGMTFMRLSASGTRPREVTQPSEAFLCSAGSTPNLAFTGGAGVNLDVGTQMAFLSQLGAAMYRGTSEFVGGCAPGLGSPVTVGVKVGFAYYFGV